MNNITIVGLVITLLWLVAIGYYFYVSRQQKNVAKELEELREILDSGSKDTTEQVAEDGE